MRSASFAVLASLLVAASPVAAADVAALSSEAGAEIDHFFTSAVADGATPGLVALVVNRDGVIYHGAFGMQDEARGLPMQKDTIFRIASMTKPLTTMAALKLVGEGRLSLDDDAARWLPHLRSVDILDDFNKWTGSVSTRPARMPITIRHLLTHTSGIGYGWSDPGLAVADRARSDDSGPILLHEPGARWTYGESTSYVGAIVAQASAQRFDVYLRTQILEPLAMRETFFEVPREAYGRVATVHQMWDGSRRERPNPDPLPVSMQADGGLYATAGDYGRFIRMLLNDGELDGVRILPAHIVREAGKPQMGDLKVREQPSTDHDWARPYPMGAGTDTWGFGFQVTGKPRRPFSRSEGSLSWAGIYNTHFWVDPYRGIGAVLMMQTLPFYDERATRILDEFETLVYRDLG